MNQPILPEIGVLALVPDPWDTVWQQRHYMLTRLARYFQVVWVNPAHEWREMLTGWRMLTRQDIGGTCASGFTIYTPEFWLPKLYRPEWVARLFFHQRLKHAARLLTNRGCQKIILYLWRPEFEPALLAVPFDLSCYHIDDEYSFSEVELPPDEVEMRLIAGVDQVFIHSPALIERKGGVNPYTVFVPNGVDYQAYAQAVAEPADLVPIRHPRIGYTGRIKTQLDWPLLLSLTLQHPDWSFVFIGPIVHSEIAGTIQELSKRSNVYFLGAKLAQDLVAYPQHFDVCIMPYQANDYTKYIYPLKLHEYLASGRPVVGTWLPSLEKFTDVVSLAHAPDEWSAAIRGALSPAANTSERRAVRQCVARRHDWQLLAAHVAETMARRLGEEFADRLGQSLEMHGEPWFSEEK